MSAHFSPKLFTFLKDLQKNNDREWFAEHKERYETFVKKDALAFIEELAPHVEKISPNYLCVPKVMGGALYRIYNDQRFHKNKPPYKTHVGIHMKHKDGKDAHAPGLYIHLDNKECFIGGGLWSPEPKVATKIRSYIENNPTDWKKYTSRKSFRDNFELSGDSLKRPPRGVDKDHPLIEDLKRKSFIAVGPLEKKEMTSEGAIKHVVKKMKLLKDFSEYLCDAVGADF